MTTHSLPAVRTLDEATVRSLIGPRQSLDAVRAAFVLLAEDRVTLPAILDLEFPDSNGEAHVKGAHLHGEPLYSIKVVNGFYDNAARGLPNSNGLSLVFSAEDGTLRALLFDNGYLTELRTGSAGALAADLLANPSVSQALIVGAGTQARYQLEALLLVRRPERVLVWARAPGEAAACALEMQERLELAVEPSDDLERACRTSDLIVTTTPSRVPLIQSDWVGPGTHITAMGSDFPGKQELDSEILRRADVVAADHPPAAAANGELRGALETGALELESVIGLGALAAGRARGRTEPEQITVADLVGLGVQDAAVASLVVAQADQRDLGATMAL